MTGGQMAPTTLLGQRTTSSPTGREAVARRLPDPDHRDARAPARACPTRPAARSPTRSRSGETKAMLRRAFEIQLTGGGFSIVEVLSTCPVGWGMTPTESMEHLARDVVETYPLGVLVDRMPPTPPRQPGSRGGLTDGARDDLRRVRRPGHPVRRPGPRPGRGHRRADRVRGCRPTAPRCAAGRRRARSSSPTARSARRSSTAPTASSPSTRRRWPSSSRCSSRAGCSSSTPRSSRPSPDADRHRGRGHPVHGARPGRRRRPARQRRRARWAARASADRRHATRSGRRSSSIVGEHRPALIEANLTAFDQGFDAASRTPIGHPRAPVS